MKIIVGLGNPGKQYEKTRHNVGWMVVDRIVQSAKIPYRVNKVQNQNSKLKVNNKFKSEITEIEINGEKIVLIKPITFMNLSGEAVSEIYRFYKDRITLSDIIVVHDDWDLDLGRIKIQLGGGSARHNGIESIIKSLGSEDFIRLRIGTGPKEGEAVQFVLTPFKKEQSELINSVLNLAVEAIILIVEKGVETAMNEYNTK